MLHRFAAVRRALPAALVALLLLGGFRPQPADAAVQTPGQAKCLASLAKASTKVVRARLKDQGTCLADAAEAVALGCPSAEACLSGDLSGKVADAAAKLQATDAKACAEAPGFGRRPLPLAQVALAREPLGLMADLLGGDLDAAVAAASPIAGGAACQAKVHGAAAKMLTAMGAAWDACAAAGISAGTIADEAALAGCLASIDSDAKGKVASARRSLDAAVAGTCDGLAMATLFPGACGSATAFGDCVEASARCRACRLGAGSANTGADCDAFDDGLANGSCSGFTGRCNGSPSLCERRFDQVAYPTTHNAMGNAEENWPQPNQRYGMTRQLSDGIRSMMLDTYEFQGQIVMCHAICDLGETAGYHPREPLVDGLARIREYLEVDADAVVSIIFESYITEAQAAQAFVDAGLDGLVHSQPLGDPWPTLGALVASGKRLVVFTDDGSASLPWHHYVWDYAWETPYSYSATSEFTCAKNRGTPGAPLYILNHFLTDTFGSLALAQKANKDPLFTDRALQCQSEAGQVPNFVTVDFYNVGPLFRVTDELNGIGRCTPP